MASERRLRFGQEAQQFPANPWLVGVPMSPSIAMPPLCGNGMCLGLCSSGPSPPLVPTLPQGKWAMELLGGCIGLGVSGSWRGMMSVVK